MFVLLRWSIALAIFWQIQADNSIICNFCQYTQGDPNTDCVTNPVNESLATLECTDACWSWVQTLVATGDIYYISRGCKGSANAGCDGAPQIENCYYVCDDRDLCNDQNYQPPPKTTPKPSTGSTTIVTETPGIYNCYSCVYSYNPGADTTCINNASASAIVRCSPDRYCTIFRQWSKGENFIRSFSRGCEIPITKPENSCIEDTHFITYNTYCHSELCNSGDGLVTCAPPNGGSGSTTQPWLETTAETTRAQSTMEVDPWTTANSPPITTFNCYSCVYSYHPDAETTCIDNPAAVPFGTVLCPSDRVCTTFRQWAKDGNIIRSFSRGCQDAPMPMFNTCVEDPYFVTCNSYCDTELCNSGEGVFTCPTRNNGINP